MSTYYSHFVFFYVANRIVKPSKGLGFSLCSLYEPNLFLISGQMLIEEKKPTVGFSPSLDSVCLLLLLHLTAANQVLLTFVSSSFFLNIFFFFFSSLLPSSSIRCWLFLFPATFSPQDLHRISISSSCCRSLSLLPLFSLLARFYLVWPATSLHV